MGPSLGVQTAPPTFLFLGPGELPIDRPYPAPNYLHVYTHTHTHKTQYLHTHTYTHTKHTHIHTSTDETLIFLICKENRLHLKGLPRAHILVTILYYISFIWKWDSPVVLSVTGIYFYFQVCPTQLIVQVKIGHMFRIKWTIIRPVLESSKEKYKYCKQVWDFKHLQCEGTILNASAGSCVINSLNNVRRVRKIAKSD